MEFLDLMVEDIINLFEEDNNNMRVLKYDLRRLLKNKFDDHKDMVENDIRDSVERELVDQAYSSGYTAGYEDALDEVEDSIDKIRRFRK